MTLDPQSYQEQIDQLTDKVDGLESELNEAIKIAFSHGAHYWCKKNYPELYADLVNIFL